MSNQALAQALRVMKRDYETSYGLLGNTEARIIHEAISRLESYGAVLRHLRNLADSARSGDRLRLGSAEEAYDHAVELLEQVGAES